MATVTGPSVTRPDRPAGRPSEPAPATTGHVIKRRRLLALAGLGVVLALASAAWFVWGGSGEAPPATGAAKLVPADALAYVSLSTDSARPAVKQARSLAARFPDWPLLETAALNRLSALVGGSNAVNYATQIRPWLGNEAALALVPTAAGAPQSLIVLDVTRPARAQAFLASAGAVPAGAYSGIRVRAYPSGTQVAFVGHYLVAGPAAAVRAAIDAGRGRAQPLTRVAAYQRAAADEPADRVLDAYLPAAGVRQLLATRTGLAGAIGLLLDRPGVQGTTISISAESGGARLVVHSALARGGASSSAGAYTPTLQSVLPSGSALMLDTGDLDRSAPQILGVAAAAGIGANIAPLLRRLGAALTTEGVNVRHLLSIFAGETAVAISPGATPALLVVARVRNAAAARSELAALEGPLSALFSPSQSAAAGQVPELADTQIAGATVHELQLGPGLQVDFGVFDGLAVMSTSVAAIEAVAQRSHALGGDAAYKATLPDQPGRVTSLVFGDLSRLLSLGERMGLTSGAGTRALLPDLSKVRAIGLRSTGGDRETTTELRLEIP